jgi:hypothetical protein
VLSPSRRPPLDRPGQTDGEAARCQTPPGYRDWTLISVARVGGPLNDLRAKLGNDVAIRAYRDEKIPFPTGRSLRGSPPDGEAVHKTCFPCHAPPKIATSSSPVTHVDAENHCK